MNRLISENTSCPVVEAAKAQDILKVLHGVEEADLTKFLPHFKGPNEESGFMAPNQHPQNLIYSHDEAPCRNQLDSSTYEGNH